MTGVERVGAAIAPLLRDARVSSEQISQVLFGHEISVSERTSPWMRVRTTDGYEGWLHEGYLAEAGLHESDWRDARLSLGCTVLLPHGAILPLPLGALVPRAFVLESGEALSPDERARRFSRDANVIARTSRELYAGAAYLWGGVSPWGADCSGFVQRVFALHGVVLPRDSAQQADAGVPAGEDPLLLGAADLLFFSEREDGRITHVAVALGDGQIAHCALGRGGHRVEDLRTPDKYVRELLGHFRFARRVL